MNGVNMEAKPAMIANNRVGIRAISVSEIVKKISSWYFSRKEAIKLPIKPEKYKP